MKMIPTSTDIDTFVKRINKLPIIKITLHTKIQTFTLKYLSKRLGMTKLKIICVAVKVVSATIFE